MFVIVFGEDEEEYVDGDVVEAVWKMDTWADTNKAVVEWQDRKIAADHLGRELARM